MKKSVHGVNTSMRRVNTYERFREQLPFAPPPLPAAVKELQY